MVEILKGILNTIKYKYEVFDPKSAMHADYVLADLVFATSLTCNKTCS